MDSVAVTSSIPETSGDLTKSPCTQEPMKSLSCTAVRLVATRFGKGNFVMTAKDSKLKYPVSGLQARLMTGEEEDCRRTA